MSTLLRAVGAVAALSLSGCASSLANEPLSKEQVRQILAEERIGPVASVEQQPQSDGTVSLLIESNLRETSFSGCLVDRADLEVAQSSGGGYVVNSMSEQPQLVLAPCDRSQSAPRVSISGNYSDEKVGRAIGFLKKLVSSSLAPDLIFGSQELKETVKDIGLDDVHSMLIDGDVIEFQVLSKALAPRLLGVRFSIEGVRLKDVRLNDNDGIEVVPP